ncbi:glycoside hydrolase family 97 catalytic domain-containing protein [Pontiellaceae bacterium B12227]|nr:glycoside hydrolase family 97 catalytic domain-containing protein [Pontiellaceae bacterium B12227]
MKTLFILTLLLCSPALLSAVELKSPNGDLTIHVEVEDGQIFYSVTHSRGALLLDSRMGIIVSDKDLGSGVTLGKESAYTVNESYPWRGNKSLVKNHCNGKRVEAKSQGRDWVLELRAYNEGIAFRYLLNLNKPTRIKGDSPRWQLPNNTTAWYQTNTRNYEGTYTHHRIDQIPLTMKAKGDKIVDATLGGPITLVFPNGMYGALTEANVMGYSGMTFKPTQTYTLESIFEDNRSGWMMDGAVKTPWRLLMVAEDLNALVNNDLVHNVCPAPDPDLFPKGIETDWIQPGRALWQWWAYNDPGTHWSTQKEFVDQAAALNCRYYLVDEGWEHSRQEWFKPGESPWVKMKELCNYAAERNVGIWAWRSYYASEKRQFQGLDTEAKREEFFKKCAEVGIKGVKLDFINSESQKLLNFYEDCLRKGAEYKIMLNFHGANKPAGEARTWPNEMTREGIHGLEQAKWRPIPLSHYTTLPFTRMLAGHGDFTPTTFQEKYQRGTSSTLQLATAVLYTSSILCWADQPEIYLESSALEYVKKMPTVWDETRVLKDSTIGGVAAFARRSGDTWYVVVLNGTDAESDYSLDLSFLPKGRWAGSLVEDDMSDKVKMKHSQKVLKASDTINVTMHSGGGFLLRLQSR